MGRILRIHTKNIACEMAFMYASYRIFPNTKRNFVIRLVVQSLYILKFEKDLTNEKWYI